MYMAQLGYVHKVLEPSGRTFILIPYIGGKCQLISVTRSKCAVYKLHKYMYTALLSDPHIDIYMSNLQPIHLLSISQFGIK